MTRLLAGTYDNPYFHDNVYGHTVELLRRQGNARNDGCIHLDIGCGYARIAEPLIESLGVHYVGVDEFEAGIKASRERGLEIHAFHLGDKETTYGSLKQIVGDRHLISISMLDVLEHLPDGDYVLNAIQRLAAEHTALVVISVPNVSHADIGFKLAFGKWSYTEVGLLDHTHVRMFNRATLSKTLRSCGLHIIDSYDIRKRLSDQHFPEDHPALSSGTLLHTFLHNLRQAADNDGNVYQFVQLCVPGPRSGNASYITRHEKQRPFLSIVTRTQGIRIHTLREVITSLAAQTEEDFEVLILAHRITLERQKLVERVIEDAPAWLREKIRLILVDEGNRTRPLNIGFEAAKGHYISILDDDDMPKANWVETFKELAVAKPGRMVRTVAVRQNVESVTINGELGLRAIGPLEMAYSTSFDFMEHLRTNHTPPVAVAFPRGAFHEFNIRFDETLTTTEDWDYIMRVAGLVGVISSDKITAIYRWWLTEHSSRTEHDAKEWRDNHQDIFRKLDRAMLLYPEGTTARIRFLLDENDQMKSMLQQHGIDFHTGGCIETHQNDSQADLLRKIYAVIISNSWKITAPIRMFRSLLGKQKVRIDMIPQMQTNELETFYQVLLASRSWRITAPLRRFRKRF